jgi:hypothetical protein
MLQEKQGVLATVSRDPSVERTVDEDVVRSFFALFSRKPKEFAISSPSFILKIQGPKGATCPDQPADTNSWLLEELSTSYTQATDICSLRHSNLETWF